MERERCTCVQLAKWDLQVNVYDDVRKVERWYYRASSYTDSFALR